MVMLTSLASQNSPQVLSIGQLLHNRYAGILCMSLDGFKGARYLLIIHEVLVAKDFFPAGVQDEALEEESQRLAS